MANILNQLTTKEAQDLFLDLLSPNKGNVTKTCSETGISRDTYYVWCKDESFSARLLDVAEERLDFAEDRLQTAMDMVDVSAIKYYLDAQGRRRGYGQASKLEISGPDGTPIAGTVDVIHYPPEPTTIREWEEQVAASRALRLAEAAEAKLKGQADSLTGTEAFQV